MALDFDDQPLSAIPVAAELAREIEARSTLMWVEEGEVLYRQGDPPGHLYYVKSGEISLTIRVCLAKTPFAVETACSLP